MSSICRPGSGLETAIAGLVLVFSSSGSLYSWRGLNNKHLDGFIDREWPVRAQSVHSYLIGYGVQAPTPPAFGGVGFQRRGSSGWISPCSTVPLSRRRLKSVLQDQHAVLQAHG